MSHYAGCERPDMVVAQDDEDMTIKAFCESCGRVSLTVTEELWQRSTYGNGGRGQQAELAWRLVMAMREEIR